MSVIIILILLGILLFVIEFMLVPGITIAGIGGLVLTVLGVYKAYVDFGAVTGTWVLIGTIILSIFVIVFSLRSRTWKKFMLNTTSAGTVGEENTAGKISAGEVGKAVTRLAPIGKIMVNDQVWEAKSIEGYIDANSAIEIVSVDGTHITVRLIKK